MPNVSWTDGAANTSIAHSGSRGYGLVPANTTRPSSPDSRTRRSSAARSGPSPTTSRVASGTRVSARTSTSVRLLGTSRPTVPMTRACREMPSRSRAASRSAGSKRSSSASIPFGTTAMRSRSTPQSRNRPATAPETAIVVWPSRSVAR